MPAEIAVVRRGRSPRGDQPPDLPRMQVQHDALVRALRDEGVEVVFLDRVAPDRPKSCSPRDSVIPRA